MHRRFVPLTQVHPVVAGHPIAVTEFAQRTREPIEVSLQGRGKRRDEPRTIEIDQRQPTVTIEEQVVGIEVGVPKAECMEARDQGADRAPIDRRSIDRIGQSIGERAGSRNLARRQIGAITEARAQIACRHRFGDGQTGRPQLHGDAELAKGPCRIGTVPEEPVAAQTRDQSTTTVVAHDDAADRCIDDTDGAATAPLLKFARSAEQRNDARGIERGGMDQSGMSVDLHVLENRAHDARGIIHGRSVTKPCSVSAAAESICIFRLSALGDVTHMLPLVHRIRRFRPEARITWIIGKFEARLVGDLPDIEFIAIDKKQGLAAVWRELRSKLRGRRFDALLLCQLAARANLLSTAIRARRRIGYERAKSKEGHGLFINERITPACGRHVLDTLYRFGDALELPDAPKQWDIPVGDADHAFAERHLPGNQPTLIISPCSSHALRNWHVPGYARVAEHAIRVHGLRVMLCGGPSSIERETGAAIERECAEPLSNLIGQDTLKQACALMSRAQVVMSPDAGPMHIANAMGTPVLGLHAATDSRRSGAYSDLRWTVDRYDAAARKFLGKQGDQLPWGKRVEYPGVMDLIEPAEVLARLDALIEATGPAKA